jgi:hypothetical protein
MPPQTTSMVVYNPSTNLLSRSTLICRGAFEAQQILDHPLMVSYFLIPCINNSVCPITLRPRR